MRNRWFVSSLILWFGGTPISAWAAGDKSGFEPLITNDAVIFGILMVMLGLIFWTSSLDKGFWKRFYSIVPMLLVCYFVPSLLTLFQIVDHHESKLYHVATRYLLPTTLVLLILSIDLKEIMRLGPKALIMFLTGSAGVILGGPLAILLVSFFNPDLVSGEGPLAAWRGFSTVAGSWIGGGANQVAMKEVFMSDVGDVVLDKQIAELYGVFVTIDIFIAEIWMMFLLLGVGQAARIDRWMKADASSIERLKNKMEAFSQSIARIPSTADLMIIAAIGFGGTALCHLGADYLAPMFAAISETTAEMKALGEVNPQHWMRDISLHKEFFWIVILATTIGLLLSFTPLRNYEGAGASKLGTVFIFILVAVIGMQMDIRALKDHLDLFLVGGIWMLFHVGLLFLVAWLIRAPFFFLAVGSKANIGGAASAPVVAAAFHPSLAPVGVLLAVLGYALGTYGAMLCAWMMQAVSPGG